MNKLTSQLLTHTTKSTALNYKRVQQVQFHITAAHNMSSVLGQNVGTQDKGGLQQTEQLKKLSELIGKTQYCMMSTLDEKHKVRSRPMVAKQIDENGDIWFLTGKSSGKVAEVKKNPHQVNLAFVNTSSSTYISISGTAREEHNEQKIKESWTDAYRAWFPKGLEDPEITGLRVTVDEAEYWNTEGSAIVHAIGFVKALATGQHYSAGQQEHGIIGPNSDQKQ